MVEFFSQGGEKLGDKVSLTPLIHKITSILPKVLSGAPLSQSSINDRWRWAEGCKTRCDEDRAYSLQGIFDVELAPVYGEGESGAFDRLKREIYKLERCMEDMHSTDLRDDKKRIEDTKGGLLTDSYRWVLNNTTFRQWHEDQHRGLLWVKGDPGKGKTMLLCGIINELQNQDAPFCHTSSSRRPTRALTVLQLCCEACYTCSWISNCRLQFMFAGSMIAQVEVCSMTLMRGSP
jgi:hypothetical protein